MSTKMIARGIVGSVRLLGVTAALAVGLVTVSAAPAQAATTGSVAQFKLTDQQGAALANLFGKLNLPQVRLPAKTCVQMDNANVPDSVLIKLGCIVIPEEGEITGGSIFG